MRCQFAPGGARSEITPVDNLFIAEYMPHAEGLYVQVYLYGLMQCYHASMADAPLTEALGLSEQAVVQAFCYWQREGLVRISSEKPLVVEYCRPAGADTGENAPVKYHTLVESLANLTAPRQFGMRELRHVYDWIEVYGLEEGAVLQLVSHCLEGNRRRSIQYMTAVAQAWAEAGVHTREDAMAHINAQELGRHGASEVLRAWSKRRKPTVAEMALYDKWVGEWGFTGEAVQTVVAGMTDVSTPSFDLLDSRLSELRDKGLTTGGKIGAADEKDGQERDFAKLLFARAGKAETATRTQRRQIAMYLTELGMPRELLLYAAERSRGANEPFGMMKKLLSDWHAAGIADIAGAERAVQSADNKPAARGGRGRAPAHSYAQHEVSDEALEAALVDLDKDL